MTDSTLTWGEIKARYPHICDPVNRHIVNEWETDELPEMDDDTVWHIIEFTRLQLMAWAVGGPITETLAIVMDEDLVHTYITHAVMSSMLQGD